MIRTRLHDLEMAYRFYTAMSPRGFNKSEFKTIVKSVTKCDLTEGQVETIFAIFDSNQNGQLDAHEFLSALQVGISIRRREIIGGHLYRTQSPCLNSCHLI